MLFSFSIFASSFCTSHYYLFIFTYRTFTGITIGICYFVPVLNSHNYFPNKKSIVTEFILGGFGLGGFVFSLITLALINPNNEKVIKGGPNDGYFPKDIADNLLSIKYN